MLTELKRTLQTLNADTVSVDELMIAGAMVETLTGQYTKYSADVPNWLIDARTTIDVAIHTKTREALARKLRELEAEEAGLLTAAERRTRNRAAQDALRARLGLAQPSVVTAAATIAGMSDEPAEVR